MTVLVAGAHAVGKTYLAKPAAQQLGLRYATASQLIREERGHATWTTTRQVTQIDENQVALVSAVARILDGGEQLQERAADEGYVRPVKLSRHRGRGGDGISGWQFGHGQRLRAEARWVNGGENGLAPTAWLA